jgi:hypothetical protein
VTAASAPRTSHIPGTISSDDGGAALHVVLIHDAAVNGFKLVSGVSPLSALQSPAYRSLIDC